MKRFDFAELESIDGAIGDCPAAASVRPRGDGAAGSLMGSGLTERLCGGCGYQHPQCRTALRVEDVERLLKVAVKY